MASGSSKDQRIKGNSFFENAQVDGIGYVLKKGRLQDAISCYHRAHSLASNDDERASASKNLGKASFKLAKLIRERSEEKIIDRFHFLKEGIEALDKSLLEGESCKSEVWKADIWQTYALCIEEFLEASDEIEDLDLRVKTLMPIIDLMHVNFFKVQLHLKIGNSYFHDGVKRIHNGDFSRCLSRMKDCYYPIQEAKRLSSNSDYEDSEISVLEIDVFYTTCTAESVQARHCGSEMLERALKDEETLNMDHIWVVIDWFQRAVILSKERDLEQEAIALGRLGFVYNKVLKLRQRSKTYYRKAFELVESMKPRTFFTEKWYQEIVSTLQEFQIEDRKWDDKEKQKEREKKLEAIKEEMEDLKKNNTGEIAFLIFLYTSFPPTHQKNWKKPSDEDMKRWKQIANDPEKVEEVWSLIKKAISHYHPDRVREEEHGEKWKTLCEEISKLLSVHFESIKMRKHKV